MSASVGGRIPCVAVIEPHYGGIKESYHLSIGREFETKLRRIIAIVDSEDCITLSGNETEGDNPMLVRLHYRIVGQSYAGQVNRCWAIAISDHIRPVRCVSISTGIHDGN